MYWRDALKLEMKNVEVAFDIKDDDYHIPPAFQHIACHLVFDIKMGSLKRKVCLVAGGHTMEPPAAITYASVVSHELVRIALTVAALNNLRVMTADIQNAYLNSPCDEKIWTILGPEWGPDQEGKKAIIVRALYRLKSAGASFRAHLAGCMNNIGYTSCLADPDVWLRPNTKSDGSTIYEYILIYTDDFLAIGLDPKLVLNQVNGYCKLKEGSIGPPNIYLGAKLHAFINPDGKMIWTQSSSAYVLEAVKNTEAWCDKNDMRLLSHCNTPMLTGYQAELDTTPLLSHEQANWYQSAIGALRWAIELGRVDINTEVSILASQMAMPREGNLVAVLRIFGYLKRHHNSRIAFNPTYPKIDHDSFPQHEWQQFYGKVKELILLNAPEAQGQPIVIRFFVDADHAGDHMTCWSRTGFICFINRSPIIWYSKKQGGIEGATFGSEFMAVKTAVEVNYGHRYKLRMMGIPIDVPVIFTVTTCLYSTIHRNLNPL